MNNQKKRPIDLIVDNSQLDSLQLRSGVAELCVFYGCVHGKRCAELSEKIPPFVTPASVTRGTANGHRFMVKLPKPTYRTSKNSLPHFKFPASYKIPTFKAAINVYLKDCALGAETLTFTRSKDRL